MGRLIDCSDVYNAIQITADNFGVIKGVVESNMLTMLSKIETVEAIPKDQYEARLKADMVAILDKIRAEIEQLPTKTRINWDGCCPDIDYPEIEYVDVTKDKLLKIIDKHRESEDTCRVSVKIL